MRNSLRAETPPPFLAMQEIEILNYVKATAQVMRLPLDDAQVRSVTAHLGRTAAMAALLEGVALSPEHELPEIYRPAPFPQPTDE
jgi:hypothetical protein